MRIGKWLKGCPKWVYLLAVVTLAGITINSLVFYPGYMSGDSLGYLLQAKGLSGFDSLHPIFTSLLWRALIHVTHHESAMLALQIMLLWGSALIAALYVFMVHKSKAASLGIALLPALPYVFNISGVMWSDVLLVGLLFFAVSLSLWLGVAKSTGWRVVLFIAALGALMMALMVRYNTVPAVIPVIALVIYQSGFLKRKVVIAGATVVTVFISLGGLIMVSQALTVQDKALINGPRLDDIVNIASRESIATSTISAEQRDFVLDVFDCSEEKGLKLDVIHNCVQRGDRAFDITKPHTEGIATLWNQALRGAPIKYLLYKIKGYAVFIFPVANSGYIWHHGIDANDLNITVRNPLMGDITYTIINNFFYRYFPFLFEPWFWALVAIVLGWMSLQLRRVRSKDNTVWLTVFMLSLSGLLVIASYFPTGATVDYRYIYWPAVAGTVGAVLLAVNYRPSLKKLKK